MRTAIQLRWSAHGHWRRAGAGIQQGRRARPHARAARPPPEPAPTLRPARSRATPQDKCKIKNEKYKPTVSIQTKKENNHVIITVSDNGNGIPQNIIDKIFQPFFTTKPTGQGTGLGLSLAYDIITKEHNGTLKVESREGEGTMFLIRLPT